MTTFVFANNINTALAGSISPSATTISVASTANLPASIPGGQYLVITVNDAATRQNFEIMYATAISGSTLTVVRAQEGTTALSWLTGDYIYSAPTAGQMQSFGAGGVTSFNTRTGAVTLTSSDVTSALTYTPFNQAGGAIGGNTTVNGTIRATSTFFTNSTTAILATGPGTTGVTGTIFLKPQGYSSTTGQVTLTSTGVLGANPTATNPASGVESFAFFATGNFGGGFGMTNGGSNWGSWIDSSGNYILGYGTGGGALTAVFKITSGGNLVALGTIQGGTTP